METKLLPEFQAIVDELNFNKPFCTAHELIADAVTRCQQLALRVPEMSDAEIWGIWHKHVNTPGVWWAHTKAVLAAYESKRFRVDEPFDFDKWKAGGWELIRDRKVIDMEERVSLDEVFNGTVTMRRKA